MLEAAKSPDTELYEFGPFRVDAGRETLLRAGESVPLTPKAFQVLLVLVRHSQEVVTKEDLLSAVWPETFVEEANLSRNIFMLRRALGETPKDHRYILTVPGRGYRLTEDVHLVPGEEVSIVAASHSTVAVEIVNETQWGWRAGVLSFCGVLALTCAATALSLRRAGLASTDTVVLAGFANTTGDPVFDGTLRQGLAVQLGQSPFLSLVSDQRIEQTLRMMDRDPETQLTPEVARDLCRRIGSAAVLDGSIAPLGREYVLSLRARKCRTGDLLDQEQIEAGRKEDVLKALSLLASKLRKHLGESRSTLEEHDAPLPAATTQSLEALQAYDAALRTHASIGASASVPLFRRATELDPRFAMAHAFLGRAYADLDESEAASESIQRAWEMRGGTSDRERYFITANYQMLVTGDMEATGETAQSWARTYPRDAVPHLMASGFVNKVSGRYEQAIGEARKAIALDPDFAIGYYNLAVNNAYLDRFDEAGEVLRFASQRGLAAQEYLMLGYDLAFLRDDRAGMERIAQQARGSQNAESWLSNKEAFALAYRGQMNQARSMSRRSVAQALQSHQPERAGLAEAGAALHEAFWGNGAEARERAAAAMRLTNDRESVYGASVALALTGETTRPEALADELDRRFPNDTSIRFSYGPVLRAQAALNRGNPARALLLLQPTVPNELGATRNACFGALYPAYVRGEAYLASGRGADAAAEFGKIVQHRGIVVSDPAGPMALLQLGRAYAMVGNTSEAITAYREFFALWARADPQIPVLQQAKVEAAALGSDSRRP